MEDRFLKGGWLIVLACAMGVSGWSIYWVMRHIGAPAFVAVAAPVCFDTVALMCGMYSLKYLRRGYSGALARLGAILFGWASAFVNFEHANLAGEKIYLGVIWAVPSIAAIMIYEVHARYEKGASLLKAGRANAPLPALGFLAWLLFFRDTLKAYRAIIAHQRKETLKRHAPEAFLMIQGEDGDTSDGVSETKGLLPVTNQEEIETNSVVNMADIRSWARRNSYRVGERGTIDQNVISAYMEARKAAGNE